MVVSSNNKRINLTVPDDVYQVLRKYEIENGVYLDATACLQLIIQRLKTLGYL